MNKLIPLLWENKSLKGLYIGGGIFLIKKLCHHLGLPVPQNIEHVMDQVVNYAIAYAISLGGGHKLVKMVSTKFETMVNAKVAAIIAEKNNEPA